VVLVGMTLAAAATPVHRAVRDNDVGYLRDLLVNTAPSQVNAVVGRGVTPLHLAAVLDHAEAVGLLLRHGADIDARSDGGFTPLHWAASRDSLASARLLVGSGADVAAESLKGITPLHWAANRDSTNVVRFLLDAGADVDRETETGATPLHWALMKDDTLSAEMLADVIITRQMESELTNPPPVVATEQPPDMPPESVATDAIATDIYISPAGKDKGRALIVEIGMGQTLVFEWVRPLNLWAGKYEVTNAQFRRFRPSHSSMFREDFTLDGPDQPVVQVNWDDAEAFCEWLNRTYGDRLPRGFKFRLPMALEWTLLARCGESRRYPWGNRWPPRYGNYSDLTARENLTEWRGIRGYDDGFTVTCPVSKSGINEWGLYGMGGNVWEWCLDWYTTDRKYKVRRGGSWDFDAEANLRINAIGFDRPTVKDDTIGFRVVASVN